jgi:CRISPR-associated protein Csx17
VEWGGKPVDNAIEFAEAAASLGTDRGIDSFQRYSLIKRRGDSYLALPLGRVPVREQRDGDLLQELDRLLVRIDQFARNFKSVPADFQSRRRRIDAAIYEFALHGRPRRMQNVLASIGRMERYFACRDPQREPRWDRPLSGLSPRWLTAANDGSVNFRIAAAVASIAAAGKVGPVRANLAPVDPSRPWTWTEGAGQTAWRGNSLADRMCCLLRRRLMDAERLQCGCLPLWSPLRISPGDAAAFLAGDGIDEVRIEDLLFACTLIDAKQISGDITAAFEQSGISAGAAVMPRTYALLKHLFHPKRDWKIRPEPAILSLLAADRTREACEIAQRRLRISGLIPVDAIFPDECGGTRLAASLLLPIYNVGYLSALVIHKHETVAVETAGR